MKNRYINEIIGLVIGTIVTAALVLSFLNNLLTVALGIFTLIGGFIVIVGLYLFLLSLHSEFEEK